MTRLSPNLLMAAFAASLLLSALPVRSEEPASPDTAPKPRLITLAEALEMAAMASKRLDAGEQLVLAADSRRRAAEASRMPELNIAGGYTRYSEVPELTVSIPGTQPLSVFPNIPDNFRARLSMNVPVYTGGRIPALIDAATQERAASDADLRSLAADIALETRASYWTLVTAIETERVYAEALRTYDAHLKDAENRERFGMAARNEVLAVQVERDRAELAGIRASSDRTMRQATLASLLGLAGTDTTVVPADALESPQLPPLDVVALTSAALDSRPERNAAELRVHAADAQVSVERAAGRPQVAAAAGYDYANPNRRFAPATESWRGSWDAGFTATFTLFDGGRTKAAVGRAEAQALAARLQLDELDRRIRLEVEARVLDLQTAEKGLHVAERSVTAAEENRRVAHERYREGVSPSSELLDAETALLRAGLDRTDALARLHLALASLDRAVGR